jgi:hypothetical protein
MNLSLGTTQNVWERTASLGNFIGNGDPKAWERLLSSINSWLL